MGGPFRAIVGGQTQYRWSFPPAQAIRVNNHSQQYGHLIEIDEFVAPGQIGMVIPLENPLVGITFKFEAPPQASVAAPIAGQVALVNTYDVAEVGVSTPPLGPDPGLLLPIGLDSPQHLHHHTNVHLHGHSATHVHDISAASHFHGHSATHSHTIPNHQHFIPVTNNGGVPAGAQVFYDGVSLNANHTGGGEFGNTDGGGGGTSANAPGNTDSVNFGNTAAASPGSTDNASPGDSDLENVQHTHQ